MIAEICSGGPVFSDQNLAKWPCFRLSQTGADGTTSLIQRIVNAEAYREGLWADQIVTTDPVEEDGRMTLRSTVLHLSKKP
jgi:hypothetical protein